MQIAFVATPPTHSPPFPNGTDAHGGGGVPVQVPDPNRVVVAEGPGGGGGLGGVQGVPNIHTSK